CWSNSRQHSTQMLDEVWRQPQIYGMNGITCGAPNFRLRLFKESSCSWTTKLHVIDKNLTEQPLENTKWELRKPIPLDDEGNLVESAIGKSPDVHNIYVCIKMRRGRRRQTQPEIMRIFLCSLL
ncbi:unnamed protein product, partial [Eruca vesicaria subsp. sativa]|nr:unnamed protein product [Eruca vesicaria subsp. sativa]